MRNRLPCRLHTIVTTAARTQYLRVINASWGRPHRCGVASLAHISRRNMLWRLARGRSAVVATHAIASDAGVIETRG